MLSSSVVPDSLRPHELFLTLCSPTGSSGIGIVQASTGNHNLALAKSTYQWLNHKGICHLHLLRLNPELLQLLTFNTPAGKSGWRMGHLVLQGNWILDIFRNWFHDPNPCISSRLGKHKIPSWWHQLLMISRKTFFCKVSSWLHWTLSSPRSYILTFPTTSLEQFLRALWGAVSQAESSFFP